MFPHLRNKKLNPNFPLAMFPSHQQLFPFVDSQKPFESLKTHTISHHKTHNVPLTWLTGMNRSLGDVYRHTLAPPTVLDVHKI